MADRAARYGQPMRVDGGDYLYRFGDRDVDFFLVVDGEVDILESDGHGGHVLVTTHRRNQFTGEINQLSGRGALLCARVARPATVRKAALALAGEQEDDSIGVLLLWDIRAIFDDRRADRLPSNDLANALVALPDRPWSEWRKGKPLTANALSRLLKPFSIASGSIHVGTGAKDTPKGYKREQFEDAWSRYTSSPVDTAFQTATTPHPNESAGFSENQTATKNPMWRFENGWNANESAVCGVVADWNGEGSEQGDSGGNNGISPTDVSA